MATLADALAGFAPVGAPDGEVRARRERIAEFLRSVEDRVWRGPDSVRERLRRTLGWDDESLHALVEAPMVVHSSTHVSMNAFAPMMTFPWFCLRTGPPGPAVHLRTQVTHNNLSDSRWKPHVWWRYTTTGDVTRSQLFSRGPRFEHQILLAQPVPELPEDLCETDAEAVELARHATNFAYFAMIYRMVLERHAGLHRPAGTVEIPIDLMNTFALAGPARRIWTEAMHGMNLPIRLLGTDNKLSEASETDLAGHILDPHNARTTMICPNYINVGQAYRLGVSITMGAEKMSAYLPEMNQVVAAFLQRIGESCPEPAFLGVSRFDIDRLAPLPALGEQARSSLPLVVAEHGTRLCDLLDRALTEPVGETADVLAIPAPQVTHGRAATPQA